MNKIERLSSILVKLQSRKYITAQQIADQFHISKRTVYRDLRILEESGVPIVSNLGIGYSLIEGYKLPPLMFTIDEAIAFLMAEKLLSQQSNMDNYDLYRRGMDKIRTAMKTSEKYVIEDIEQKIRILNINNLPPKGEAQQILQPIVQCMLEHRTARIEYYANYNKEVSVREIEPIGFYFMNNQWYVMAWCCLRNDYRSFKLTRIQTIIPGDKTFRKTHPELKTLLEGLFPDDRVYNITIKVEKEVLSNIKESKYTHGMTKEEEQGDYVIQNYITYSLEHFGRWYLSFADKAQIIEPIELKDTVKDLMSKITI